MIADAVIGFGLTLVQGFLQLLPETQVELPTELPSLFAEGITLFGKMDRYVPITEMLAVAAAGLVIRGAMFALWIASFIYSRLPAKGT